MKKKQLYTLIQNPVILFWFYILMNLIPSLYFATSDHINTAAKTVLILFPLGLYFLIFSLFKNSGRLQIVLFPLLFLHAFQIVLFFLFGKEVIAADMFLNLVTTNTNEATELLARLIPAIILVCALYIPTTFLATLQWTKRIELGWKFRKKTFIVAIFALSGSLALSFFATNKHSDHFVFNKDAYPINVLHNLGFAVNKWDNIRRYPVTSQNFSYQAEKTVQASEREIAVLIIGETSRADNWQLYGYNRPTTPQLLKEKQLIFFRDALTQSNTTHKSVSIILSDASAENYHTVYSRKSVLTAFKEAGYTTVFLSNQAENGSFIEYFSKEADTYVTLRKPDAHGAMPNPFDMELLPLIENQIRKSTDNLLIVLHTYGSHFNYSERYPRDASHFQPDQIQKVGKKYRETLLNAYDNSIRYTDTFLSEVIRVLKDSEACASLLYTSDHGEDIFDDARNRFLHASPSPTYYQLRIPLFFWYSDCFYENFPDKVKAAQQNSKLPVSTNIIFHSLLDMASIQSPYHEIDLSILSPHYKARSRMYLDDHDTPVPYQKMNLGAQDLEKITLQKLGN